jgi:hypothetical protein
MAADHCSVPSRTILLLAIRISLQLDASRAPFLYRSYDLLWMCTFGDEEKGNGESIMRRRSSDNILATARVFLT